MTKPLTFATKSPYPSPPPPPLAPPPPPPLPPSRLLHISLLARHGTRNPSKASLRRMNDLHHHILSDLHDPPWLRPWAAHLHNYSKATGALTPEGERELSQIGYRFATRHAKALDLNGGALRVRSSYKSRAILSAHAFLHGYLAACSSRNLPMPQTLHDCDVDSASSLSSDDDPRVEVLPMGRDLALRYFEQHRAYASFATKHKALPTSILALGKLRAQTERIAARVTDRLALSDPCTVEHVRTLGEACAFEIAHGRPSSFLCTLLQPEDETVLELLERMHRPFFKGHERFRTVAAPLVADLVSSLTAAVQATVKGDRAYAADLRFAHAETLVPLLLLLGITTNGLEEQHPDYRDGLCAMSPFAANLALELYQTIDLPHLFFVRFSLHERYITCVPALGEHGKSGIVQLDHLLQFFNSVLKEGLPYYS